MSPGRRAHLVISTGDALGRTRNLADTWIDASTRRVAWDAGASPVMQTLRVFLDGRELTP
jgi:hypothetical protein